MKQLENLTNYKIKNESFFKEAFTHKSYVKSKINNERLEFLGDALLNFFIADLIFNKNLQDEEGDLTKKRSQWVSGSTLAKIAIELQLDSYLKLGENKLKKNPRILAGVLEAYIGAVYLDSDLTTVKKLIKHLFEKKIEEQQPIDNNYKSLLQEWFQKKHNQVPVYKIKAEKGEEHNKTFYVQVFIQNKLYGEGSDKQKKQAEQLAAKQALENLQII